MFENLKCTLFLFFLAYRGSDSECITVFEDWVNLSKRGKMDRVFQGLWPSSEFLVVVAFSVFLDQVLSS